MGVKESKSQARQGSYIARNKHHRNQILVIARDGDVIKFQYGTQPQVIVMKNGKRVPFSGMINDLDFFLYTVFQLIETYVWQGPGKISRNSSRDHIITPRNAGSAPASPKGSPRQSAENGRIVKQRSSEAPRQDLLGRQSVENGRILKQNSSEAPRQDLLGRQKSAEFQRLVAKSEYMTFESPRINETNTAVTFDPSPRIVKVSSQADLLREMRPKGSKFLEDRIAIREYINSSNYVSPLRDEIISVAKRIVCDMLVTGDIDAAVISISTYAHGLGSDGMSHEILGLFNFRSFDPASMDCLFTESMSKVAYPSIKLFYHMGLYMPYFAIAPILGMRMHVREMNHLLDLVPDLILKSYDGEKLILEAILDPVNGILVKEQVPDFPIVKFLPGPNSPLVTTFVKERVVALLNDYGALGPVGDKTSLSLRLDKKEAICDTILMLKTWLECTRT